MVARAAMASMRSVESEMQTHFDLPILRVNTDDGYEPSLEHITRFVKGNDSARWPEHRHPSPSRSASLPASVEIKAEADKLDGAVRSELTVEVLEKLLRRPDRATLAAHRFRADSVAAMCSARSARTFARNSGGTSSRSVTMLAWNRASTSAGVISSNSAAVQTLRGTTPILTAITPSNECLV